MAYHANNPLILKTDYGHHAAEDVATATAHRILPIEAATETTPGTPSHMVGPIKALRAKAIPILTKFHADIQAREEASLAANGDDHLTTSLDASVEASSALSAIIAAGDGTALEAQLAKRDRRAELLKTLPTPALPLVDKLFTLAPDPRQAANPEVTHVLAEAEETGLLTETQVIAVLTVLGPDRQDEMLEIIHRDMRSTKHEHRHWFATDGADDPSGDVAKVADGLRAKWGCKPGVSDAAKAWRASHHPGPGVPSIEPAADPAPEEEEEQTDRPA